MRPVAAALVLALAAGCGDAPGGPHVPAFDAADLVPESRFLAEIDRTKGTRDCFDVLRDPAFVAADGAHGIADDELVLGLDLGTAQFAYPVRYLNAHEIVEHSAEGLDLLACW